MKDANDQEIQVGDTVVVAGRGGSSSWISKYEVVGTEWVSAGYGRPDEERPVFVIDRTHTIRKRVGDHFERTQSAPYKVFWPYQGRSQAIMVIAKGPNATPPAPTVEGHDLGDLDPKEISPFDPVPGARW